MQTKPSRQRGKQLHVPVLPAEAAAIKANAAIYGLPVAAYLRSVGLQHEPKTMLDTHAVLELAKINADLGRLGGLLKMWLSNDERVKGHPQMVPRIDSLLTDIEITQALLFEAARKL